MKEWKVAVHIGNKTHYLKSVVEYKSKQIMRIRLHGKTSTLLLENDYPAIRISNSKKGVKWKMREGKPDFAADKSASILIEVFEQLEYLMKKDFKELYPEMPLF